MSDFNELSERLRRVEAVHAGSPGARGGRSPVVRRRRAIPVVLLAVLLTCHCRCAAAQEDSPQPPRGEPRAAPKRQSLFDGRTLKHWKILDKIDFEKHGKIEVKAGAIEVGKGRPASGIVYRGRPPRVDYELTLEARRTAGDDFFCGLTFPYREHYCTLVLGGWGGRTTGLSNVDGEAAVENVTASFMEFEQHRWYEIRLRVTEPRIEAWIDKEKIVDLPTEGREFSIWWEQEPARPLGIASWYTAASWRKLKLRRLPAAKRPADPAPPAGEGR